MKRLLAFLAGAILGAAVAGLFTPYSGEEVRGKIRRRETPEERLERLRREIEELESEFAREDAGGD